MPLHNPTALTWIALAFPIVAFYLLKVRRRQVTVSTVMFWEEVVSEKQPRAIWRQLRHWFSLLLQLIVLVLLAFALADPFRSSDLQQQRRIVVVLDNSASMTATDGARTRFATACEKTQQIIRSLRNDDQMAIIAAGSSTQVLCGLTGHHRTLRNAVESLRVTDGPTELASAISIAQRLLPDHDNGRVVVLTDEPLLTDGAATDDTVARDERITWEQIATTADNVGITQFQVRRTLADPVGFQTLIEISSFSSQSAELRLQLKLDDELLDVVPLELAPGDVWTSVLDSTSINGGVVTASIDSADALAADNVAQAVLPELAKIQVTLVTDGNWFLQQVLEANFLVDLTVTSTPPPAAPDNGVLILHQPAADIVPSGRVLVIQPTVSTDLWQTGEIILQPLVAEQDEDSPLMRHVTLQNVLLPAALQILPSTESHTLVETAEGAPLYLHIPRPSGDVLVLAVDFDQTDLPLRTAFPILMTNALTWFAGGTGTLNEAVSTGQVVRVAIPESLQTADSADSDRLRLIDPEGRATTITVANNSATIGPLAQTGIWKLQPAENSDGQSASQSVAELLIACNLTNRSESDLRVSAASQNPVAAPSLSTGGHPIWFLLVLPACCLLVAEWFLFHRRRIS